MCHECHNQWDRNHGGLQCPRCRSEFVEILENNQPPDTSRSNQPSPITSLNHPLHGLHDHNPWDAPDNFPDPDEADINTVRFNTRLGNGTISFTTISSRGPGRGARGDDPVTADVGRDFATMVENILGAGNLDRSRRRGDPFPPLFFGPGPSNRRAGSNLDEPTMPAAPFAPMFSALFSTMNNLQPVNQTRSQDGTRPMPAHPLMLLHQLLNPQNAAHGDAVFSQEALDRVISQLMEQNAGSNAPGPASEEAIQSLPRRPVDESMLGSDGKAECSICMESVGIGEEVTFLPCNHWFHGQCVTAWLKEHDTCPHCRRGITKSSDPPQGNQPDLGGSGDPGHSGLSGQDYPRSTPTWSHAPGSDPRFPGSFPNSSDRTRGGDVYYDRSPRPYISRRQSRAGSRRNSGQSGGGVGSWLRSHNPFSSSSS